VIRFAGRPFLLARPAIEEHQKPGAAREAQREKKGNRNNGESEIH